MIFSKKSNHPKASRKILDSMLTRKIPLEYVARSSETRQQEMGGRAARDDLFNSRKASERMGGKVTQQPFSVPLPGPRRQSEKTCRLVGY